MYLLPFDARSFVARTPLPPQQQQLCVSFAIRRSFVRGEDALAATTAAAAAAAAIHCSVGFVSVLTVVSMVVCLLLVFRDIDLL